jgi:nitrate/nitrite transporter NarK
MNLFARGLGGFVSDAANQKWGMPGRLWVQTVCLAIEGSFVLIFVNTKSLAGAILVMLLFSTFVQAAEGAYFRKMISNSSEKRSLFLRHSIFQTLQELRLALFLTLTLQILVLSQVRNSLFPFHSM